MMADDDNDDANDNDDNDDNDNNDDNDVVDNGKVFYENEKETKSPPT